jgi:hypothetical protein
MKKTENSNFLIIEWCARNRGKIYQNLILEASQLFSTLGLRPKTLDPRADDFLPPHHKQAPTSVKTY